MRVRRGCLGDGLVGMLSDLTDLAIRHERARLRATRRQLSDRQVSEMLETITVLILIIALFTDPVQVEAK